MSWLLYPLVKFRIILYDNELPGETAQPRKCRGMNEPAPIRDDLGFKSTYLGRATRLDTRNVGARDSDTADTIDNAALYYSPDSCGCCVPV